MPIIAVVAVVLDKDGILGVGASGIVGLSIVCCGVRISNSGTLGSTTVSPVPEVFALVLPLIHGVFPVPVLPPIPLL